MGGRHGLCWTQSWTLRATSRAEPGDRRKGLSAWSPPFAQPRTSSSPPPIHPLTDPVNRHPPTWTTPTYQPTHPATSPARHHCIGVTCRPARLLPIHIFTVTDSRSSPPSHHRLSCLSKKISVNPRTTHRATHPLTMCTPSPTAHWSRLTHPSRSSHPSSDISSPPACPSPKSTHTDPSPANGSHPSHSDPKPRKHPHFAKFPGSKPALSLTDTPMGLTLS